MIIIKYHKENENNEAKEKLKQRKTSDANENCSSPPKQCSASSRAAVPSQLSPCFIC